MKDVRGILGELQDEGVINLKVSMRGKILYFIAGIVVAVPLVISGVIGYGYLDYKVSPFDQILTNPYFSLSPEGESVAVLVPGQKVYARWHYIALRDDCISAYDSRWTQGERVIVGPRHTGIRRKLGEHRISVEMTIPQDLSVGRWTFEVIGDHKCNPIKTFVEHYPTIEFDVIDKPT